MDLVGKMTTSGDEIVTVFYGEEVTEDQAQAFVEALQDAYPDCEIELYAGGQPLYYYLFSVGELMRGLPPVRCAGGFFSRR